MEERLTILRSVGAIAAAAHVAQRGSPPEVDFFGAFFLLGLILGTGTLAWMRQDKRRFRMSGTVDAVGFGFDIVAVAGAVWIWGIDRLPEYLALGGVSEARLLPIPFALIFFLPLEGALKFERGALLGGLAAVLIATAAMVGVSGAREFNVGTYIVALGIVGGMSWLLQEQRSYS